MKIIDLTAGSKSMWFDTQSDLISFCDLNPKEIDVLKIDWSVRIPFENECFDLVVFDPPHLTKSWAGTGEIAKAYGYLFDTWESDLINAFNEAMRITRPNGLVIFKWNTRQISIHKILKLIPFKPLFGHTTAWTNKSTTLWAVFVKRENSLDFR